MPQKKNLSNADSDLKNFSVGSTDRAQKFHGSADLHTPIQPPLNCRQLFPQLFQILPNFYEFSISFRKCPNAKKNINLFTFVYQNAISLSLHQQQLMLILCFYRATAKHDFKQINSRIFFGLFSKHHVIVIYLCHITP